MKIRPCVISAVASVLLVNGSMAIAHWPDQPPHQMAHLGDFPLERGGVIPNLKISYVTHGKLDAAKSNAILVVHGFASNHHQLDHLIGPGRPLDTDKYFIICPDALGATQTTYEHSTSATNSGLKMSFPLYNGRDTIKANYRLVTETLGISHLVAVTGYARGATFGLQLAVSYPDFVDGIVLISGGALWGKTGLFRAAMLPAVIESCEGWRDGDYDENPKRCAANAMAQLIPYIYSRDWWMKYVDSPEAHTKWRNTWGEYFLDIQDARDLYYLVKSGGRGSLADTPGFNGDLNAVLQSVKARTLFIGSPHDQAVLPKDVETQVKAIPNARAVWIDSIAGHSICCNGDPQATWLVGEAMRKFLLELRAPPSAHR